MRGKIISVSAWFKWKRQEGWKSQQTKEVGTAAMNECGKHGLRQLRECGKPIFENQTDFAIKTQSVGEGNYKEWRRAKHNETKKNKSDKTICSFVSSVDIFNSPGSLAFKDRSQLRTESLIATHYWLQASVYHRKGRDVFGVAKKESPMSPNIHTVLNARESTDLTLFSSYYSCHHENATKVLFFIFLNSQLAWIYV